jgi:hypothetical protein
MSKQTAVDWLQNELWSNYEFKSSKQKREFIEKIEQAKAMEREQRIQDMSKMQIISDVDFDGNVTFMFSPEQYYNERYK